MVQADTESARRRRLRHTLVRLLVAHPAWVLAHAPDYSWAILALPNKSDWWIWHRDAEVPQTERSRLLERARSLGLDARRVVRTPPAD